MEDILPGSIIVPQKGILLETVMLNSARAINPCIGALKQALMIPLHFSCLTLKGLITLK